MWEFITRNGHWLASCAMVLFGGAYLLNYCHQQYKIRGEIRNEPRRIKALSFRERYEEVEVGMSLRRAEILLGPPTSGLSCGRYGDHYYQWRQGRDTIWLTIDWDDLVRSKSYRSGGDLPHED